jgi:multicomponent Na+:H+ antiporter subunit E
MFLIRRILNLSRFLAYYTRALLLANVRIAQDVLSPGLRVRPGFFTVDLQTETDLELLAYANLVTMTPGTLSLDVSADGRKLLIHAMYAADPEQIKKSIGHKLQSKVLGVFRW